MPLNDSSKRSQAIAGQSIIKEHASAAKQGYLLINGRGILNLCSAHRALHRKQRSSPLSIKGGGLNGCSQVINKRKLKAKGRMWWGVIHPVVLGAF